MKPVPLRTCAAPQKTDYPTEVVERYEDRLKKPYFAILMLASAGDEASIAHTLNVPRGTVKSRLSRARAELAKLIRADAEPPAGASTVLGAG